ncbi:hypothetical protein BC826DRAFT_14527 [Russula brevipes]|nr:hypothetical protein BC826DRAFT_14527 [Russula brevipes]
MTGVGTPKYGRTSKVDLEFEVELQSSVGSAVDMTGIGTQMYGRTAVAKRQNSNVPAATVTKVSQPSQSPRTRGQTEIPSTTEEANTSSIPLPLRTSRSSLKASSQPGPSRDSASTAKPTQGEVDMPPNWTSGWRWDGRSNCSVRSCDANENVSPGQRTPASAEAKQPKRLRDLRRHNHVLSIESRMKTQSLEKSIFISNM